MNNKDITGKCVEVLSRDNDLPFFSGTVALGVINQPLNPMVIVWTRGMRLNDPAASLPMELKHWCSSTFANWPVGNSLCINKGTLSELMGIRHLNCHERGYRLYRDTKIGDVLYITIDNDPDRWTESILRNRIDLDVDINIMEPQEKYPYAYESAAEDAS